MAPRSSQVRKGDTALHRFVVANPHARVMTALQGKMGQTRFVRWSIRGAEFPPRWPEALAKRDTAWCR
jgi:hypothetical protein